MIRSYRRHIPELDGLRGLAVAAVVFSHIYFDFEDISGRGVFNQIFSSWVRVTKLGWLGVDVFFVLSGFLITGILANSLGQPNFYKNFYMRRILRIFPLYYSVLGISLVWYHFPWKFFAFSALFLSNTTEYFHIAMVFGPLWSLSVEEHFYLFWPWMIRLLGPKLLAFSCLALIVGEPLLRLLAFRHGHFYEYASWFRFDGLAFGALVSLILRSRYLNLLRRYGTGLIITSIATAIVAYSFGFASRKTAVGVTLIYSVVSALTAGVISLAVAMPNCRWFALLRSARLRFIGDISFCIYLVHTLVIDLWRGLVHLLFGRTAREVAAIHPASFYLIECSFVWTISLVLAYLSLRYLERPIRNNRFKYP
jgi:peptidoglycan/LPS O-acetylase OafA/YrhL